MLRRTVVVGLTVALVVGAAWIGQAFSQEQQPGGGERPRDAAQMQQRMEQYRQQAAARMKEALGVTDEEWTALQPKIEKVQTLSRETRGGFGGFGGRSRRPGGETATTTGGGTTTTATQPQSATEQAMTALQKVLENKEATSEQIQTALKALRDARAKAQAALEAAQKDLREVVTVRQEAVLVTMRVLN